MSIFMFFGPNTNMFTIIGKKFDWGYSLIMHLFQAFQMLLDRNAQILTVKRVISGCKAQNNLSTIFLSTNAQWVFLFYYNCFWCIHDVKRDVQHFK